MNRSWVRFPQAAQIHPPGSGWAFLYAVAVLLVAPRVFRAPEGPAAREARRPHFVRRRASKPARALRSLRRPPHQWYLVADVWRVVSKPGQAPPPPTGAAARPSGTSGALHTSGAWSLMCGSARRLEARPGPAAAHGRRSQVHQSLRHRASKPTRAPRPGPVDQAARLFETGVAFARVCLCGIETVIAFACEKWVFLVQFSGAEVMSVSVVPCWR